jgi:hypothetical protein
MKMGRDSMLVVDNRLRVYGIDNLRIADASIIPHIASGNIMAHCVVIGEKAAEMIKAGGYSGGSTDRPDFLDDVRARKIDVIVVYKVDRLTRSLADFAKLVELFAAKTAGMHCITAWSTLKQS